jgi:hypothetical protein
MENDNNGLGYGGQDPFQAAGLTKTNSYDMGGNPISAGTTFTQSPINENNFNSEDVSQNYEEQPSQTQDFDLSGRFGGRFNSIDEVEQYFMDYETKSNQDPFANDFVRNLNKAMADGIDPDLYVAVSSVNTQDMDAREALVIQAQWENGLSREDAEFFVNRNYRLTDDGDELDMSDPDVREAQIRMNIDSQKAKDFIESQKSLALESPKERFQAQVTQAWEPVIPKVVNDWKEIKVQGKSGEYSIPASPEALNAAQQMLSEVIQSGLLDMMPSQEGLEIAHAMVEKEILKHDFSAAIDYIADSLKAKQLEDRHNPRRPVGQYAPPMPSQQQGLVDFLKSVRG